MNSYFGTMFSKMTAAFELKTVYRNENLTNDIGNYPRRLYKYKDGTKDHDFTMIEGDYIWASSPVNFDDPTDSFVNLNVEPNDKDRVIDLIIDNYNDLISRAIVTGKINTKYCTKMTAAEIKEYKKAITTQNNKYSATKNRKLIQKSKNRQLAKIDKWLHSAKFKEELSNAIEVALESITQSLREHCKICCLTMRKDNQKLWEGFAGMYSGFVIEYDTRRCLGNEEAEVAISNMFKVSYRRYLPTVPLYSILEYWVLKLLCEKDYDATKLTESLYEQLLFKKKEYLCEEEWRVISSQEKIAFPAITAVYMGYKITPEKEERLKKICFSKGIPLYKQRFGKYSTKMFFTPIQKKEVALNESNER